MTRRLLHHIIGMALVVCAAVVVGTCSGCSGWQPAQAPVVMPAQVWIAPAFEPQDKCTNKTIEALMEFNQSLLLRVERLEAKERGTLREGAVTWSTVEPVPEITVPKVMK